jgi:hypothetical protein
LQPLSVLTEKYKGTIQYVDYNKAETDGLQYQQGVPLQISIGFARQVKDENRAREFGDVLLPGDLARYDLDGNVFLLPGDSLQYSIERKDKRLVLNALIGGLPRYPSQIYEAVSYFIIFLILAGLFYALGERLRNGYIFGMFLFLVFAARFFIEFLKQNQETFEDGMSLNMGQLLSIPFAIAGLVLVFYKWPLKRERLGT